MRQVFQKSYLSKELCVEEVPAPVLAGTGVLVRNAASLISPGTERATIAFARKGLLAKVKSQPERVQLLLRKMKQVGVIETAQLARRKLENPIPMGYSTAGVVLEASADMLDIRAGDRVACAGAKHANHAEVVYIPKNLCVPLPDALTFEEGAFVAPGAIALHGVRLAEIGLGENILVIGLGLIGQLAAQLVSAQGATAIGIDLDAHRLGLARTLGLPHAFPRNDTGLQSRILELTGGRGVDAVLVTAATPSHDPVYLAGELCRDRGKVVIVGDVGMQVPRSVYYRKELSVIVSRSYGPGRYDDDYEVQGRGYPAGYVRWTERDNMAAFLKLAADGKIQLKPLIEKRFPVSEAALAYDLLADPALRPQPLGIILSYPQPAEAPNASRKLELAHQAAPLHGRIGLSVIGAGNFLAGTLLPLLKAQPALGLRGMVSHSGLSAKNAGVQGGFAFCATDIQEALLDPGTNAVLIATRHDSHADLICRALAAGKHVFVEKPLATGREELSRVIHAARQASGSQVMVGFNRRFAPLSLTLKKHLDVAGNAGPMTIHYRVLAGHIPEDSWIHRHGGRLVGEVCHFIDWCRFITREQPVEVSAQAVGQGANQDIAIQLCFSNGSVAHIEYLMRIDPATAAALGKERITVSAPGLVAELDDFKALKLTRGGKSTTLKPGGPGNTWKGHAGEIQAFAVALQSGEPAIPFADLALTTETTFAILDALRTRALVRITEPE
jgi:predicted dehydrogenase/threonine dehydrogenase-like Zn-dependent dehydrogenase